MDMSDCVAHAREFGGHNNNRIEQSTASEPSKVTPTERGRMLNPGAAMAADAFPPAPVAAHAGRYADAKPG